MIKFFKFRRKAREKALQAIYCWQISKNNIEDIQKYFLLKNCSNNMDIKYFNILINGVVQSILDLDNIIKPYLLLHIKRLGEIEKAILRISLFELSKRLDVPYKVIINEGIELAKYFGDLYSYKFINGILDEIGLRIRPNKK